MKIKVLKPHGTNPFYETGDEVERSDDDAAQLIRSGLAEAAETSENKKKLAPENKKKPDPDNK